MWRLSSDVWRQAWKTLILRFQIYPHSLCIHWHHFIFYGDKMAFMEYYIVKSQIFFPFWAQSIWHTFYFCSSSVVNIVSCKKIAFNIKRKSNMLDIYHVNIITATVCWSFQTLGAVKVCIYTHSPKCLKVTIDLFRDILFSHQPFWH